MNYVEFLGCLKDDVNVYLIVLLSIILITSVLDWCFGWINARLNSTIEFKSCKAITGIITKMMYFIVLILFSVIALAVVPHSIAIPSIMALYLGYLLSEINSILYHLNITSDGKEGEVFSTFINKILRGEK